MTKAIATEQTPENIAKVLALLADSPGRLAMLCAGHGEDQLRLPLGQGERSAVQVLAHLLHCEALTAHAISAALLLKEPLMLPLHPERDFGALHRYDQQPFADLLAYFRLRRALLLRVLEPLREDQWARALRQEGKQRLESVYWQARGQALHELEHLDDLQAKGVGLPPAQRSS